jgi:16S rRNA G966 N2-methylase RsmD
MKNTLRLFPYIKDRGRAEKLLIDADSIHYITSREYATKITEIIIKHVTRLNKNSKDLTIIDATAGVGGDTLTFAKSFNKVYAIEIDKVRCSYLQNNIKQYNFCNVITFNDNCLNVVNTIKKFDIIFLDVPWEPNGDSYKNHQKLTLPFCDMKLENFCNKLFDSSFMACIPSFVVLKLPKNYDMQHFYDNIMNKHVYYYDLGKMIILVLLNNNIEI